MYVNVFIIYYELALPRSRARTMKGINSENNPRSYPCARASAMHRHRYSSTSSGSTMAQALLCVCVHMHVCMDACVRVSNYFRFSPMCVYVCVGGVDRLAHIA